MSPDKASLVCLGVISASRGLKGEVRIKSFTEDPDAISAYGPLCDKSGERTFDFKVIGLAKGQFIARIKGINDRSAADALRGTELYIKRDALPAPDEDVFYHRDLIGLLAKYIDGETVGTIRSVDDFGAGTLLEIETAEERGDLDAVVMVPFTRDAVPTVDIKARVVMIAPMPGILAPIDGEKDEDKERDEDEQDDDKKRG
jgi:16S rRNA processing protein RimM